MKRGANLAQETRVGERGFLEGVSLELSSGLKGSRSGGEQGVCECEHACVWGQGISRSCLLFSEPNQLHFAEAAWSEQLGLQAC